MINKTTKTIACVIAGLTLTACGGSATPANNNGEEMPDGDNSGGDNSGGGGGNATDCTQTPFHDDCLTNNAPALALRVADCITDGNAGIARCNTLFTASASNTCLTNPFTDACTSNTDFTTYADMARTNRVSFCETTGNESNALCMDANLMSVCNFNPFSTICTGETYLLARQTRCVANSTLHSSCTTILGSIVDITDIPNHGDLPATVAEAFAVGNTDARSFFVSVGANGVIDTTGLTTSDPPATLSRAGDMRDGVTYVRGFDIIGAGQSFVGLLPSTNLGAPLPSTTADAAWTGRYFSALNNATHDITFNIDFEEGTIDARDIKREITNFDLDFTETGIITGNVNISSIIGNNRDTGQARGLIGEQGLVGTFANTDGGFWRNNVMGGFVADNPDYTPPNN